MSKADPLAPFSAPTRAWFGEAFATAAHELAARGPVGALDQLLGN